MASSSDNDPFDLAAALGAQPGVATKRFTVYLPDKDQDGRPIEDREGWITACMNVLVRINNGVTRLPEASGMWRSGEGQPVIEERTTLVYSFLTDEAAFRARIDEVREFLHLFGNRTNQGEVMVEMFSESEDGLYSRAYRIFPEAWAEAS